MKDSKDLLRLKTQDSRLLKTFKTQRQRYKQPKPKHPSAGLGLDLLVVELWVQYVVFPSTIHRSILFRFPLTKAEQNTMEIYHSCDGAIGESTMGPAMELNFVLQVCDSLCHSQIFGKTIQPQTNPKTKMWLSKSLMPSSCASSREGLGQRKPCKKLC